MMDNLKKITESLSRNERKILPLLKEKNINEICRKSNLDKISVIHSLEFLQNKGIVNLIKEEKKMIYPGVNGMLYRKKGLPERRLLKTIADSKKILSLQDAKSLSRLSENEFKAAVGALKKKAFLNIKGGKIILTALKEDISKKMLEEIFLDALPLELSGLIPEQKYALKFLQNRKGIVELKSKKVIHIQITELGKKVIEEISSETDEKLIEQLDSEMIKSGKWKGKKFRRYDVVSSVPAVYGGKRHFVNQSIDYVRRIWVELGFEEMSGNFVQESFWNFDALFTPQDHPVREMQDTFYLSEGESFLKDKKLVQNVRKAHESGIGGSKGWNYSWSEEDAKKLVLRTHTTCLSAKKLYELSKKKIKQGKFFAVGKVFRNETVDWSHGFEFYQTEGIVVGREVNFRNLLGYLKEFYTKMGFSKIKFTPAYFPYTEPSVEILVWHPEKKTWLEMGGAGMFRPEITIPLLGENIPVLAWGQGVDRIIMDYYKIKDLREMYKNNINFLRNMKFWVK